MNQLAVGGVYKRLLMAITDSGGNHRGIDAGMLSEGKLETVCHVVSSILEAQQEGQPAAKKPLAWGPSVTINVDTFERLTL